MPRPGVHRRDDPVLRDAAGDAPPPRNRRVRLDVLARHDAQQAHGVRRVAVEVQARHGAQGRQGVIDQRVHEVRPRARVGPVAVGLGPPGVVVVRGHRRRGGLRHQAAHPADLRADHRDGVLGRHGVLQQRRVQRPAGLPRQRAALIDHRPHRVEDQPRAVAAAQPRPPQHQHRVMERPLQQAQPRRGLPPQVALQALNRLPVRQALQGLQHQHRRHHRPRHRRAAPPRREQALEQLVGEQPQAVLGQEPIHRPLRHQLPAHRPDVQQPPVSTLRTLHAPRIPHPEPKREPFRPNKSAVS